MDFSRVSENLFSNFLTVFILGGLGLIIYLKFTKQTFGDFFRDLVGAIRESRQEGLE